MFIGGQMIRLAMYLEIYILLFTNKKYKHQLTFPIIVPAIYVAIITCQTLDFPALDNTDFG